MNSIDPNVLEAAARWHARLRAPDCSLAEREAFEAWCVEKPSHVSAWLSLSDLYEDASALQDDIALQALVRPAMLTRSHMPQRRRWMAGLALATAATLMLVVGLSQYAPEHAQHFANPVGTPRAFTLDDGTHVVLDTDSAISVRMDARRRELTLERGQVSIRVASDERAFEALAAGARVKDIGTEFQVRRWNDAVEVALLEGLVDVSVDAKPHSVRLAPGERVEVSSEGAITSPKPADLAARRGWTEGKIFFSNKRLDALLSEVNRYSSVKIRLQDTAAGTQSVSGALDITTQGDLLQALEAGWGLVKINADSTEIVLAKHNR